MLNDYWYMICPETEIKANKIKSIRLLGKSIVLFRTSENEIIALEDRCCHRNVKLSLGFLKNDRIVCGYHGWQYDTDGLCRCIPSQSTGAKIPPTAKIKRYHTKMYNRWLWIFMGAPEKSIDTIPPDIPELQNWPYIYQSYEFNAELVITAESLIDPYHIAFAHRHTIGSLIGQIDEHDPDFHLERATDVYTVTTAEKMWALFFKKCISAVMPISEPTIASSFPTSHLSK
jgi:vanillate O-demethylase monooxygenase subunit